MKESLLKIVEDIKKHRLKEFSLMWFDDKRIKNIKVLAEDLLELENPEAKELAAFLLNTVIAAYKGDAEKKKYLESLSDSTNKINEWIDKIISHLDSESKELSIDEVQPHLPNWNQNQIKTFLSNIKDLNYTQKTDIINKIVSFPNSPPTFFINLSKKIPAKIFPETITCVSKFESLEKWGLEYTERLLIVLANRLISIDGGKKFLKDTFPKEVNESLVTKSVKSEPWIYLIKRIPDNNFLNAVTLPLSPLHVGFVIMDESLIMKVLKKFKEGDLIPTSMTLAMIHSCTKDGWSNDQIIKLFDVIIKNKKLEAGTSITYLSSIVRLLFDKENKLQDAYDLIIQGYEVIGGEMSTFYFQELFKEIINFEEKNLWTFSLLTELFIKCLKLVSGEDQEKLLQTFTKWFKENTLDRMSMTLPAYLSDRVDSETVNTIFGATLPRLIKLKIPPGHAVNIMKNLKEHPIMLVTNLIIIAQTRNFIEIQGINQSIKFFKGIIDSSKDHELITNTLMSFYGFNDYKLPTQELIDYFNFIMKNTKDPESMIDSGMFAYKTPLSFKDKMKLILAIEKGAQGRQYATLKNVGDCGDLITELNPLLKYLDLFPALSRNAYEKYLAHPPRDRKNWLKNYKEDYIKIIRNKVTDSEDEDLMYFSVNSSSLSKDNFKRTIEYGRKRIKDITPTPFKPFTLEISEGEYVLSGKIDSTLINNQREFFASLEEDDESNHLEGLAKMFDKEIPNRKDSFPYLVLDIFKTASKKQKRILWKLMMLHCFKKAHESIRKGCLLISDSNRTNILTATEFYNDTVKETFDNYEDLPQLEEFKLLHRNLSMVDRIFAQSKKFKLKKGKIKDLECIPSKELLDLFYGYFGENCTSENPEELFNEQFTPIRIIHEDKIEGCIHWYIYDDLLLILGIEPLNFINSKLEPKSFVKKVIAETVEQAKDLNLKKVCFAGNETMWSNRENVSEVIGKIIENIEPLEGYSNFDFPDEEYNTDGFYPVWSED